MTANKQSYLNMYCAKKLKEGSLGSLAETESF